MNSSQHLARTANGRRLQDLLDHSIRHYDGLGRVISGALRANPKLRPLSKRSELKNSKKSERLKRRMLDFGV